MAARRPAEALRGAAAALLALCAAGVAMPALAQAPDEGGIGLLDDIAARSRYLLGLSLISSTDYAGSSRRKLRLGPLAAWQYDKWRVSTSGASALLGFGVDPAGPGASAELGGNERFKYGASLRIDNGRKSSDSPDLAGLPDIRRTLRGRVYASYDLGSGWSTSASLSQDLLGRQGGAVGGADLGWRRMLGQSTEVTAGAGLDFANGLHMRSYYGVTPAASQATGLRVFEPGASAIDAHLAVGITHAITPRWIAFANLGATRFLGDAAASPITTGRNAWSGSVGLGWRCCTP